MPNLKLKTIRNILIPMLCWGSLFGQNLELVRANPYLVGEWTGMGKFLDVNIRDRIGEVPIIVHIGSDGQVSARIDDYELRNVKFSAARYGFEIRGDIDNFEKNDVNLGKDAVSILLVLPEENRANTTTSDANFHLKSNHIFDFTLRVGGVILTKQ